MTEQPHPQRCETCKKYSERTHPIYEGNIIAFCGEERTQVETKAITSNHGCASHSSATEPAPDLSHIREDRRGCLNCLDPDCPVWQTADQNCWKSQKEHDAATKQAAREEVLTDLRKHLNKRADSLERNYPKGNDQRDGAQTRIAEIQQTLLALDAMESLRSGGK